MPDISHPSISQNSQWYSEHSWERPPSWECYTLSFAGAGGRVEGRPCLWVSTVGSVQWGSAQLWSHTLLSQKVVTALDRTWHPEHFFCAQCGAFFGPEGTERYLLTRCRPEHWGGGGMVGDLAEAGVRVAPPLEASSAPHTPPPQGSTRKTARPTAGRITLTCSPPSVAAVPEPSWRTTSRPLTPYGILSALCVG